MPDLSVKNVPEEEVERLRQRAKRNHRSLQGELRTIISEATTKPVQPITIEEFSALVRKNGLKTPDESTQWIREDRDR